MPVLLKAGDFMSAESVGQIGLDLVVNQNQFQQQMNSIQGLAKKAGAALAAAFAVKKIIDFGVQCIELGSDLAEVQNVVDVTFSHMSKQVDEFAKNAAASFGLSETMAKQFTGTFGAMAKAFGFGERQAYEMSTTLTGLAGDVASFYNLSQDEAYTKLKSVFTGETESLKDLGVVMTQSALDSYALANGFGKTTAKMSEMEKVALRYKFVQDQLSIASGDFLRTSDGWANQVRVLQLQFDSLKATIGQGLINVLTPVIKVINIIIGKLMSLANAFKSFTELVTGKKGSGGVSTAAVGMGAVADSADQAGSAIGGARGAAKKAAKDIKGITTGIDELNIIDQGTSSGSGDAGGGAGKYEADEFDMGELADMEEIDSKYQALIQKAKELADLFKQGFFSGLGDVSVLQSIQKQIDSIKSSLKEIFTSPEVLNSADQLANKIALNFGKITGSITSIGLSIADALTGGISKYLLTAQNRIKQYLIAMFDITGDISDIAGNFSVAFADIFTVFRSDSAKQIIADIIGIFAETFMGITELTGQHMADLMDLITAPFVTNKELIKQTLEDTFSAVGPIFSGLKETVEYTFDSLRTAYNNSIAPMYNNYILPVIEYAAERFNAFREGSLNPLIDKFIEFGEKVAEAVTLLWENVIQPFIAWFIETIAPSIGIQMQLVTDIFFLFLETVSEILGSVIEGLSGLIDFLEGIFTGDWKKAWNGINQFFASIWNTMQIFVNAIFEAIYIFIQNKLTEIQTFWSTTWESIKQKASDIWESIKKTISTLIDNIRTKITTVMDSIKTGISTALENIKKVWGDIWDNLKKKTSDVFNGMWGTIKGIINKIIGGVEKMANNVVKAINKMIEAVNSIADNIPGIDDELIPTISEVHLPRLAQGGFVKANTPQLAMIGDNRHYGEIVAPEDKMQEMVDKAVAMTSRSGNNDTSDQYLALMADLLQRIIDLIESMDLTVTIDIREIKKKLADLDKRTGYTLRNA